MNKKFLLSIFTVVGVLSVLIYSASTTTAKAVVTVDELIEGNAPREAIRLGARLTEEEIKYRAEPQREVRFQVRDITGGGDAIPVVYFGAMPDTLKTGRDVILEGHFDGKEFVAKSLMTQCPSKYEPPIPGANQQSVQNG